MYILAYDNKFEFNGYYLKDFHKEIPTPNIFITDELHSYLLTLGKFKLIEVPDKNILDSEDKRIFIKIEDDLKIEDTHLNHTYEDIKKQNAQLLLDSVEKDIKIKEIENKLFELTLLIEEGVNK